MPNLLQETIDVLRTQGKTPDDVVWVGSRNGRQVIHNWREQFNFTYNNGYGGHEIPIELVVVGEGWWLERHEYDGSEWWEFKTKPTLKLSASPASLDEIEFY